MSRESGALRLLDAVAPNVYVGTQASLNRGSGCLPDALTCFLPLILGYQ